MIRKVLCVLLCLCLMLGIFAVEAMAEKADSAADDWGITMVADKISNFSITVVVSQSGGKKIGELTCKSGCWLEAWTGDDWTIVEPIEEDDVLWSAVPDTVEPNDSFRVSSSWGHVYGILDHGRYRFGMEFVNSRKKGVETASCYAEFVITNDHICISENQDQLCDICCVLLPHDCVDKNHNSACDLCALEYDVFRVVGNADWLGNWQADFNQSIMKEQKSAVYTKTFLDVAPGCYEFKITRNGRWDTSWGDAGMNVCVQLENQTDLTVAFTLLDGKGVVSVKDKNRELCFVETVTGELGPAPRDGLFRVVGNADWLGDWNPKSDLGIMTQRSSGCYEKIFEDVPPGSYVMMITKDGRVSSGDSTRKVSLTVEKQTDLTVTFMANVGIGTISVKDKMGKEWLFEDEVVYAVEMPRTSVYRVVGNADWMGSWDASSELGLMTEFKSGYYKKTFEDVPPGVYEFRITAGSWEHSWGDNGGNYCFALDKKEDVTVVFYLNKGVGTIDVIGPEVPLADEEDTGTAADKGVDWGITLYAADASPTGMTLLTNQMGGNYNSELEYDTCYWLEVFENGIWKRVPTRIELVCPLEADSVMPNACYSRELNWEWEYGALAPGHYRFAREFCDYSESNSSVNLYAEFVITEDHTCVSKDQDLLCDICLCLMEHPCEDKFGDAECDICGKRISEEAVYRVVGNADWMGDNSPRSNQGILKKSASGVYKLKAADVAPGDYSFIITKNGAEGLWGEFSDRYEFTLAKTSDLTITLDLREGRGKVSVNGPDPLGLKEPTNPDQEVKTEDFLACFPAALLLICVATMLLLLSYRKKRID